MTILTKEKFQSLLEDKRDRFAERVVGKALILLLERQTYLEQANEATLEDNGIGFTGSDALLGTKHAQWYKKNGYLDKWAVDRWTKKNKRGFSRIAKYWKQLNEEAEKQLQKKDTA